MEYDKNTMIGDPIDYWADRVDRAEDYLEFAERMLAQAVALARLALRQEQSND